jgi:hypothetical protein
MMMMMMMMMMMVWNSRWNGELATETELLGGNMPQCHCPPKIPHDLTWARTLVASVGSRQLTARAIARPMNSTIVFQHPVALMYHLYTFTSVLIQLYLQLIKINKIKNN